MSYVNTTHHGIKQKTLMVWLSIVLLGSFALSMNALQDPVNMVVMPEVPKEGEPLILSFTLYNPGLAEDMYSYELYVNGEMKMQGESPLSAMSSKQHEYVYEHKLGLGEQTTFFLKVRTSEGVIQKTLSIPIYAPQVWTSFVSIASYSMVSVDYNDAFAPTESESMNVGLIFTMALIPMLIFLVLAEPYAGRPDALVGRLNGRFTRLSAVMFAIFMGMVLTQIVMVVIGRL